MTTSVEELLRTFRQKEADATKARVHYLDKIRQYTEKAEQARADAVRYSTAIAAVTDAMNGGEPSPAAEAFDDEQKGEPPVVPEAHPFPLAGPAAQFANGLDRTALRRRLRQHHMRYPVAGSHASVYQVIRQVTIAAIVRHADFPAYVAAGGFDIKGPYQRTWENIVHAAETIGVDLKPLEEEAIDLHRTIFKHGTAGIDYAIGVRPIVS